MPAPRTAVPSLARALMLAALLGAGPARAACTPGDPGLAGRYRLEGLFEVGSELLLLPDGRFEFMLAYGANDQDGRGCWTAKGGVLTLLPQGRRRVTVPHTPDRRGFRGLVLIVEPGGLRWPLDGVRAIYRRDGQAPAAALPPGPRMP
jgi:hypothetical protein